MAKKDKPKPLSELELAEKQAMKMLKDMSRLQNTQKTSVDRKEFREGVDQWKDSDFFFSVVFQSAKQKYEFLEFISQKFGLGIDSAKSNDQIIQIINGIEFAKKIGLAIKPEVSPPYPYANLELAQLVLDNEQF